MGKKEKLLEILGKIAYTVDCILLSAAMLFSCGILYKTILNETRNSTRIGLHEAEAIGFAAFFLLLLIPRVRHNVRWLMTFMHEFIHMFFATLFFRKLNRFNVGDKDSHVSFSNGPFGYIIITLAPYCIPLLTLAMLPWRFTVSSASETFLMCIDFLIGLTYAFHICCWARQTRFKQTDIIGPGKIRASLFILTFWILGLCLVLLTPGSGVVAAFKYEFVKFPSELIEWIMGLI